MGKIFMGREVDLPFGDHCALLTRQLEMNRHNASNFVLPICEWVFSDQSVLCTEQKKCLLLCERP
jgi:hypothetical protein